MIDTRLTVTDIRPANKIQVRDLSFFYGRTQTLKNITLDFPEKKVTAIMGPSGCGKSTLLRTINRMYSLYPKQSATGEVIIDGDNILLPSYSLTRLRTKVGMVFQKPVPFPMTIYENVAYAIRHHESVSRPEMDDRVETALREAALWEEVKNKLQDSALGLSGGQQQRLCIARAIALRPEILLFDEPTSALDPIATSKIEELFSDLRKEFTIVIVTHNLQQAARVSDYTTFLYMGELVEFGATADTFTMPREQRTKDYITGRFG